VRVEGEKRFQANCGRCHQSPHKFPPRMMLTIERHMRVPCPDHGRGYAPDRPLSKPVIVPTLLRIRNHASACGLGCFSMGARPSLSSRGGQGRVIELVADKDSRYKMEAKDKPSSHGQSGRSVVLRITRAGANRGIAMGPFTGFPCCGPKTGRRFPVGTCSLNRQAGVSIDGSRGAGDYEVVCTVICSEDHEGMHMKFVVRALGIQPGDGRRVAQ